MLCFYGVLRRVRTWRTAIRGFQFRFSSLVLLEERYGYRQHVLMITARYTPAQDFDVLSLSASLSLSHDVD